MESDIVPNGEWRGVRLNGENLRTIDLKKYGTTDVPESSRG
jgi:hypothetical protein